MSIDWNTAPEGATHWEPRGIVFGEGWMKKVGNEWSYWLEGSKVRAGVWADCFVSAEREATFEARPQETWDGQGLPPVGTVCEVKHRDIGWVRCEIVAHKSFSCGGLTHAIAWIDENTLDQSQGLRFRQLRTPEQIAAEEREKAVGDMAMSIQGVPYQYPTLYALFDAGYRRQEEGK
ncbi:hypothetical protein ACTBD1_005292 [Pseudomonas aeruginosa]|jgi:hypothetical protein|uniref:hypothetical protein n=1 Tax=Pseudomonas aeruginosa TaxID=287 RepID=UPI0021F195F1|nr:hypothetical protein [Pseudomonas aeruginosa]EIU2568413.1 hypothetical protein [Pseudomonas aeruginosa]EKG7550713.1 hypothetical protein [Pseudomonas aeruginosa]EKT9084330.1 hypothetical protein [Pseudomonas aeruginosa]ELC7741285.1 hypothetical protein [Pseudomonas aeruginosa]ELQ8268646.1 hypothetical protein [Pseudomonas aeruginosa]